MKVTDLIWLGQRLADAGKAEIQASAPGVPIAELIVMGDLMEHGPSTITDLAERTGYVQSRISSAVVRIVDRGWATTGSDPADGRRTLVQIPDRMGEEAREFQRESQRRPFEMLLANVPADRRPDIISALEELLGYMRGR